MKNNHIIYNLDDYYPTKKGWTYILLSRNKKYMKIGKSVAVLETRIKNIKNDLNYKQFDFDFLLAIEGCYYEKKLFSVFSEYRACCFWKEGKIKSKPLTSKEINKRVSLKVEEFNSDTSYVGRHEIYRKFVLITRLELFKIPPRKVAPKVKDIVRDYLDKEYSLNG